MTTIAEQAVVPVHGGVTDLDLVALQLQGLDRWHTAHRDQQRLLSAPGQSREQRLVSQRRCAALAAAHQAVMKRADGYLTLDGDLYRDPRPRVVLAHRNDWLRAKVATALEDQGVRVVASVADGAQAVAALVCDQPDLVLVEDRLPTVPGHAVVLAARAFSLRTVVAVQADSQEWLGRLLDKGVRAWFSRRIPPAGIAAGLADLLREVQSQDLHLV